jgi:hypothetical protein
VSEGAAGGGISIYLAILVAGFAVTYVWRFLGALAVTTLHPESAVLLWVRAVATALVAALVARLVTAPSGLLAETPALARYGGIVAGLVTFALVRRVEPATGAAIVAFFVLDNLA